MTSPLLYRLSMPARLAFLLLLFLLSACGSASVSDLKFMHDYRAAQLEQVARQFMKNGTLYSLGIAPFYDPSLCEHVNAWHRCSRSGPWENWDIQAEKKVYLDSLPEVLKREHISATSYKNMAQFLRDNNLRGIAINSPDEVTRCVAFEAGLDGLLYAPDTTFHLTQDQEYLYVKRLSPHWHLYSRDWN